MSTTIERGRYRTETAPRPRPRWRRRRIVAIVVALTTIATVALATVLYTGRIGGSVQVSEGVNVIWSTSGTPATPRVVNTTGVINCATTFASVSQINVNITGALPGATCTVEGRVRQTAGEPNVVPQNITFAEGVQVAFDNGECGKTIIKGSSGTTTLRFTIKVPDAAGTYPANGTAGVQYVQVSEFDQELCPTLS